MRRHPVPALVLLSALVAGCAPHGSAAPAAAGKGVVRHYYVSAEPVVWDYAPTGRNQVAGRPFGPAEDVFVGRAPDRVGSRYLKCLYRGYADSGFGRQLPQPGDLGTLGPVLRAEVGDTLEVVFRNRCPFPASMHPHGVRYDKASEGATYADGGPPHVGGAVPTGRTVTYTWHADARSGPGPMEGSSAVWMYHSHSDEVADVSAGLTGFLVVTARGRARPDGSPKDVDQEVFSLFQVMDENSSPLLAQNVHRFVRTPPAPGDEEFAESNLMHAVNGYVYGNGPVVHLRKGQRVRWYLMGMGSEVDLHTPHWHGTTVLANGMRTDVVDLLPASMVTADLVPDSVGTWLFHCHVGDHIRAGMQARYVVDG
ncbi:MAG: multicopper oxidase domain-containing protein [Mycobacteriales bacterium]